MNKAGGFVVLHRKILDWEWYKEPNTAFLFIHLILNANFADTRFKGEVIKRGQLVTSLAALSEETGLSIQQVKTALKHLISTGEITNHSSPQYRIITISNYSQFQDLTNDLTSDQQTTNKRLTNDQQHHNNNNNITREQGNNSIGTASRFTPPTIDQVRAYCQERKNNVDPERWLDYYTSNGWKVGRNPMKDWKAAVRTWEKGDNGNYGGSKGYTGSRTGFDPTVSDFGAWADEDI